MDEKRLKKELFVMLFTFFLAISGSASSALPVFAAQGGREGAAALANSQVGQTDGTKYGASSGAAWCAYFAGWCARNGGGIGTSEWPNSGSTTILVDKFQKMGRWHDKSSTSWSYYKSGYGTVAGGGKYDGYTPQPGDFVAIDNNGSVGDGPEHTGIVYSVIGNTLTTIEGNISKKVVRVTYNLSTLRPTSGNVSSSTVIIGFGEPNYPSVNQQPIFNLEAVSGGAGTVTVTGWAFDPDSPNTSVGIHVYIGGVCGESNAEGHGWIIADQESSDVNQAYGISGKHRFSTTIETSKRGNQKIAVYALDTGGGENPLIGLNTVYIAKPYVLEFDQGSITVNEGETKSFTLKYDGENITQIGGRWEDNTGVASCTWGTLDENAHALEVIIGGIKAGKDQATIQLLGVGGTVLFSKSMPITVNHVHKYTIEKVTKEATCSATGLKKYYCSCGAVSSQTTTIAKKSHTYVTDAAVAATCAQAGKTAGKHCATCGYVLTAQTTIPAKGHSYVTDAAVAATCTQAGKTAGKHCATCGYVFTVQTTIPAKGHSYVTDAAEASTCTQAGKTAGKHCATCGYVLTAQTTIPAKGHSYVTDAAEASTCTQTGKTAGKHCSVCGYVQTKQETIAAKGHIYMIDAAEASTCMQTGKTAGTHCSICGYVAIAQTNIPKKDHSFRNGTCIWCGIQLDNLSSDAKEDDNNPPKNTEKNDVTQEDGEKNDVSDCVADTEQDDSLYDSNAKQEDDESNVDKDKYTDTDANLQEKVSFFEKSNLKFKVIDANNKQVMVLRCLNKKSRKISIPTTIKYNGVTYSVVSISSNAFSSLKNLEEVTIGRNVTTIGEKAFYNCKKMKTLHIKSTKIKKVEKGAFGKLSIKCRVYVEDKMIDDYKKLFYKSGMNKKIRIS